MINKINLLKKVWSKIIIILIITLILVLSAAKIYNTGEMETDQSLDEYISYLDSQIPVLLQDYNIPGINIALIKDAQPIWASAYGYADLEQNQKMTVDIYCTVYKKLGM